MSKTAIQAVSDDLGIGLGYLYILKSNNSTIVEVMGNDEFSVRDLRLAAITDAPYSNNTRAFGKISINSFTGTGNLTTTTIGGVNQIDADIVLTGRTPTQIAGDIVTGINAFDPGSAVNYTATFIAGIVTVYAPLSIGSTANSHTISLAVSGGALDTDNTNPSGGFSNTEDTSDRHYWLDADYDADSNAGAGTASASSKGANAVDITSEIIPKSLNSAPVIVSDTISGGVLDFVRKANNMVVRVSGESGIADILTDINTDGRADGDTLWLIRGSGGETITVTDTGNIVIEQSIDFDIDSTTKSILLRYDATNNDFRELFRTSVFSITVAGMRTAGIPQPISGTNFTTWGLGGGTVNLTPGTDEGYQIYAGAGALAGSWVIQGAGSPIDGETWLVDYRGTFTAGGNNITIFGYSLTDIQIANGNIFIRATWDDANGVYRTRVLVDLGTVGSIEDAMIPTNEISTTKLELQAGLAAGSYTNVDITVDAQGIIEVISSGSTTSLAGAFAENMAMTYAAGTLRLTSSGGTIFSSSNVGKVLVPSTAGARLQILIDVNTDTHYFIDDTGASTIIGEEFGVTSGTAWGNARPFYLYACNLNNTSAGLKFAISPNPCAIAVPAATNIGYHGSPAATPSDLNFSFLSVSDPAALATKPCALIGRIRMTMSAATDDWTIVTDGSGTEIGIDKDPFFGYWYTMPALQMGADDGFLKNNGDTAPSFASNYYRYQIGRDGYVDAAVFLDGDGGADGVGAVSTQVVLPYLYSNTVFDAPIGVGMTTSATPAVRSITAIAIKNTTYMELRRHDSSTPILILNNYYVNGVRDLLLNFRYQAFLT